MSTSFPNSNGSVPPYNPQANGGFGQFGQAGAPGGFPVMDPYHNIYAPPANGYGAPVPPNMGAPPAGPPAVKTQPHQQFPGVGGGAKLPAYDQNQMQNGYMGYPPHQARPNGHVPQNGPPPNYNAQNAHMPHNPYAPVPDPYRMYSGMPGAPPTQPPTAQPAKPAVPVNSFAAQPGAPAAPPAPNPYPAQQQLPAHLHGAPQFPEMPPHSNAPPLQHYQPPGYSNGATSSRGAANQPLPSLQPSKQAKQDESRPNNLPAASQYPNPYAAANAAPPYDAYNAGPNEFVGFGGPSGSATTPGVNGGNMTPGRPGNFGYNPALYSNPGPTPPTQSAPAANTPGQNTPGHQNPSQNTGPVTPVSNPYAAVGTPGTSFGSNDHSGIKTPGHYGSNHPTPNAATERSTPGAPSSAPGTPQSLGSGTPKQQLTPLQQQQAGIHMTPPPQYNQNTMTSPSHAPNGNTPQKYPNSGSMGSSLPPLNGQFPTLAHSLQSPVTPSEPTFKEPAMPIRHSPSHMQSPQHQTPAGAPPAYTAPSNSSKLPDIVPTSTAQPPARAPSPTFAVPTLPAAATLAQASSSNQVSTKPKASPQKKRGDEPEPPSLDTPFTTVTHYELPPAHPEMRSSLSVGPDRKTNPPVDKYYQRKRPQLRFPYPEGVNAHTAPVTEPNTFGFIEGSKYFTKTGARKLTCQPAAPPMLNRSQSMHNTLVSPGFAAPTPPTGGRQPAKKARSASDASEPVFTAPLQPARQSQRPMDPRQMQQMQMQHYQQIQMHKMHQQNQMVAHQQHMARMAQAPNMPSTSTAGGMPQAMPPAMPPAPLGNQLPPLAPPALQRAESLPQLPSQQQPPMGGQMQPHMGGMPPMNGAPAEEQTVNNNSGHQRPTTNGLPPLTLGNSGPAGMQNHEYSFGPTTSQAPQEPCAGCHNFIMPGSATLCCMYHDCKNVYHQECTRLSSNAFNHFNQAAQIRWVCPKCESQVRPMQMQHA